MSLPLNLLGQSLFSRIRKFPLRAILGLEPAWAIFIVGGIALFGVFRPIAMGLSQLAAQRPMPTYVLPLAYLAEVFFLLVQIWFFVAFWQSTSRLKMIFWRMLLRIVIALSAFFLLLGDLNLLRVFQETFSPTATSVF